MLPTFPTMVAKSKTPVTEDLNVNQFASFADLHLLRVRINVGIRAIALLPLPELGLKLG